MFYSLLLPRKIPYNPKLSALPDIMSVISACCQCLWEKNGEEKSSKDREKLKAVMLLFIPSTLNLISEHMVNTGVPENWHTVLLWQLLDCLTNDLTLCFI